MDARNFNDYYENRLKDRLNYSTFLELYEINDRMYILNLSDEGKNIATAKKNIYSILNRVYDNKDAVKDNIVERLVWELQQTGDDYYDENHNHILKKDVKDYILQQESLFSPDKEMEIRDTSVEVLVAWQKLLKWFPENNQKAQAVLKMLKEDVVNEVKSQYHLE